jgi:hypothetical protein
VYLNKNQVVKPIINLIYLDIKRLLRSSFFKKTLPFKLIFLLLFLFVGYLFIIIGNNLYFIFEELYKKSPLYVVNNYLLYWFFFDLIIRFFLQKPPFLRVLPLMTLPIKRKVVTHYYLLKTLTSNFNLLPFLLIVPFSISLLKNGNNFINLLGWFSSLAFITLFINFLNFLIKKNKIVLFATILILVSFIILEYFNIFLFSKYSEKIFNVIFKIPLLGFATLLLPIILYLINYNLMLKTFYIDSIADKKRNNLINIKLKWLDKLGITSPYIKNDIKLILRNSKPRQYALISLTFLLYGITVFNLEQIILKYPTMLILTSILITGGFLFSYGQLIPSWDSSYYKMFMCHSQKFRNYLESKWYFLSISVIVFLILSFPYIFYGLFIIKILIASAFFNIGVTVPITLLIGSLNKKHIALNTNIQAFETNEFNSVQIIFVFIKLLLPILIFYPAYKIFNFEVGLIILVLFGIIGCVLRDNWLNYIDNLYKRQK